MATTTNFGWTTPDDTSLVKDGAAAIRTLGQSIDTSMMDLEGGTINQLLAKNSNTDMDFKWVAAPTSPIRQIVYANANTAVTSSNSATLVDTGLTATITPTSSTSTILVMVNHAALDRSQASAQMILALFRNSTSIYQMTTMFLNVNIGSGMEGTMHLVRMDSPATTSAVTYKTQFRPSSGGACTVQSSNFPSSITLMEIGA
jgi:hypothetical protein